MCVFHDPVTATAGVDEATLLVDPTTSGCMFHPETVADLDGDGASDVLLGQTAGCMDGRWPCMGTPLGA